jgi:putative FmdB family regulatory protein
MLNLPERQAYNLDHHYLKFRRFVPHYEFFCSACKKTFSKLMTIADHERQEKIKYPHCGGKNVEQCWSAFSALTSA